MLLAALAMVLCMAWIGTSRAEAQGPNVLFILTDDQTTYEQGVLGATNAKVRAQGVAFSRAYAPYPICCPARATLLTGQYMHNHRVRGNSPPFGGWSNFSGRESNALPTWLPPQYRNVYIGKYMNQYASTEPPHVPQGWNEFYGKMGSTDGVPTENEYYNYSLYERGAQAGLLGDCDAPGSDLGRVCRYGATQADYQTDVYRDKAVGFINDHPGPNPFFMTLSFGAPHFPHIPAPRHLGSMNNVRLNQLRGFNERDISDKPAFLRRRANRRLTGGEIAQINIRRRRRLEQLRSADEAINAVINAIAAKGQLNNTYIIFASDNGFFAGEHRIGLGKYLHYEPSSRVPVIIRGPGIPAGRVSHSLVGLHDIPPTIAAITNGSPSVPGGVDGRSLLPFAQNPNIRGSRPMLLEADIGPGVGTGRFQVRPNRFRGKRRQAALRRARRVARVGLRGMAGPPNLDGDPSAEASRFQAISGNVAPAYRSIVTPRWSYTIWASGEEELYDFATDPGQVRSRHRNRRFRPVKRFLFNRLVHFAWCARASCNVNIGPDPRPRPRVINCKRRQGPAKRKCQRAKCRAIRLPGKRRACQRRLTRRFKCGPLRPAAKRRCNRRLTKRFRAQDRRRR